MMAPQHHQQQLVPPPPPPSFSGGRRTTTTTRRRRTQPPQPLPRKVLVRFLAVGSILLACSPSHQSSQSPSSFWCCSALQNLFPLLTRKVPVGKAISNLNSRREAQDLEERLVDEISREGSRLANSETVVSLVEQLEDLYTTASIQEPAVASEIYGRWRLIYTTNADTGSPIQRKAVDTDRFPIYQDVVVEKNYDGQPPDAEVLVVRQVVEFSPNAKLSVDALASTSAYPLREFTEPRKTTGKVLGLNVLGVSLVGEEAQPDPTKPQSRIDFVFDKGEFDFGNGLKLPYPVPFRLPLFRDWVKGWIDVTWLSPRLRISRGNKGTTFVLVKEEDGNGVEGGGASDVRTE